MKIKSPIIAKITDEGATITKWLFFSENNGYTAVPLGEPANY
jgi:hypothetical protein